MKNSVLLVLALCASALLVACEKKSSVEQSTATPQASAFPALEPESCSPDPAGSCGVTPSASASPREMPAVGPVSVSEGSNQMGLRLYSQLARTPGNIVYSPFSVAAALGLAAIGAAGETEAQLLGAFSVPQGSESSGFHKEFAAVFAQLQHPELRIANRIWGNKGFALLPEYAKSSKEFYGSDLEQLDFSGAPEAARGKINKWVEGRTENKIRNLLPTGSISATTRLVLTNAVYFKSDWAKQFKSSSTSDADFKRGAGGGVRIPMMNQTKEFPYVENPELQAIELPYKNRAISALVLLPREGRVLGEIEKQLTPEYLGSLSRQLFSRKVELFLPKFKFDFAVALEPALQGLGIRNAFAADRADFSRISGNKDLFISKVVHKAFVEVDEKGTEAAAATGMTMDITSMPEPEQTVVFRADRPFLFLIRESQTGLILFVARIADPSQK